MFLTGCIYIYIEREKNILHVFVYSLMLRRGKKQVKRKLGKIDFTGDQLTA